MVRSSLDEIIGLESVAVDAIAFSIKLSVPKSTFKHFGFDDGQRIPCSACRVSIASLQMRKIKKHVNKWFKSFGERI